MLLRTRHAVAALKQLKEGSATGPDLLPVMILRKCAEELGQPLARLARRILQEARWPDSWRDRWVAPIHKRKAVYNAGNYRGVHMTAQLSKTVERYIGRLLLPF